MPIEMGERVEYGGQMGTVLSARTASSVLVQMDSGYRVSVASSDLKKVSTHDDQIDIDEIAEQIYDGHPAMTPHAQDREHANETGQNEQAVYFGEDRDTTHEDGGDSPHTTAKIADTLPQEDIPHPADLYSGQTDAEGMPITTGARVRSSDGRVGTVKGFHGDGQTLFVKWDGDTSGPDGRLESAQNVVRAKESLMNIESKWSVIALGEMQQPGGVGATIGEHDPETDAFAPDMSYEDNAENGYEQEVALKRWVDMAVDMLNRGDNPDLILANLAHDGCPEPETVLQRAMEQPDKEENDAPTTDEPLSQPMPETGAPESDTALSLPQGVSAKVGVSAGSDRDDDDGCDKCGRSTANGEGYDGLCGDCADKVENELEKKSKRVTIGNVEGVLQGYYESQWGEPMARVALDNGQISDLPASEIQEIATAVSEPVEDIQKFIDSFPEVNDQRKSTVHKRITHLQAARNRIGRAMLSDIDQRQRLALDAMDVHLHNELADRKDQVRNFHDDADVEYLKSQPQFGIEVVEQESMGHGQNSGYFLNDESADLAEEVENTNFDNVVSEDSAIMVSELPEATLNDMGQVHQLAASYINQRTASLPEITRSEIRGRFVEAVLEERDQRIKELSSESDDEPDNETTTIDLTADATGLFL